MSKAKSSIKTFLIPVVGILILSPDSLLVKLMGANIDGGTILFWRGLLLALCITLIIWFQYKSGTAKAIRGIGKLGLISACLFALNSSLFTYSILSSTSVVNTLVIIGAAPLFASILAYIFLREKVENKTLISILLVSIGILLLFINDRSSADGTLGNLYALGMALCLASNIIIVRYAKSKDLSPFLIVAGVLLALGALPFASFSISFYDFVLLFMMGFIAVPIGFYLIMLAPRYLPAPEVSLILLLESVLGPLWVWLILTLKPDNMTLLAGLIILTSLTIHTIITVYDRRKNNQSKR